MLSAAMFGFGHIEQWGSWRVIDTGLAGLALGYLFLRYGLAASIMLHFSFNYLIAPLMVFPGAGLLILYTLGIIIWFVLGLVFAVYYTIKAVEYVSMRIILPTVDSSIG